MNYLFYLFAFLIKIIIPNPSTNCFIINNPKTGLFFKSFHVLVELEAKKSFLAFIFEVVYNQLWLIVGTFLVTSSEYKLNKLLVTSPAPLKVH